MENEINNKCIEYYNAKLEVKNFLRKKNGDNLESSIAEEPIMILKDLFICLNKYLILLWEDPKMVAKILLNADIKNVKENLAHFFCNNFYQNILSSDTVGDNLLYVFAFMLKEEINKLNSINQLDDFLNNTSCGYLLSELKEKTDIQSFSKSLIQSIILKIEINYSEKKINLDIESLLNDLKKMENELKRYNKNIDNLEDMLFFKNIDLSINGDDIKNNSYFNDFIVNRQNSNNLFNEKYVQNLDKKELEKIVTKYENQLNMKDYLLKYINESNNEPRLFYNDKLIDKIYLSNYSKILFSLYQRGFLKLIELLNLLLGSFKDNSHLLPYSVKCICKLISIFIKEKFPDIKQFEENAFIGKFLLVNLFKPIFNNLNNIYINDFVVSGNTFYNLGLLLNVFTQLILGKLYTNKENQYIYTPFNWYFIEKMPEIFLFYESIIKIDFPKNIEKFININTL